MSTSIRPSMLKRLTNIDWFAGVGQSHVAPAGLRCRSVASWAEACRTISDVAWENAQLGAQNQLTMYLAYNHKGRYMLWNDLVDSARTVVEGQVLAAARSAARRLGLSPLPKAVTDSIKWDLVGAAVEDAFSDLQLPVEFNAQLLLIYESGHLPCGWEGDDFPNGTLLVY